MVKTFALPTLTLRASHFLCSLAALLLVVCPAQAKQPNIVFFFSDDHAWQAISAYGDPRKLNETPNIDRLAKEGMRFDRCLIPNPICGPSRATVLTGKYSHLNGFVNNSNSTFDGSQTTFPKLFQRAGYQTALIGKWHLISQPTGFDYWQVLPGQGVYYNPPMVFPDKKAVVPGYVTDIITDASLQWLEKRDKTKPFLLMCQHKAPHREWSPALRHLNHDKDRKYPEPPTLFDNYEGRGIAEKSQAMTLRNDMKKPDTKIGWVPPEMTPEQKKEWNAYYEPRNKAFAQANLQGDDLLRWRYQRYMHDYLGCIKGVDESVGKLLDYLDKEGLAEDTIVIYSSDQGFYLGEHGWYDKRWIFEESLRTPLLVRWPKQVQPGSTCKELVSNVDFAETLLDIVGLPIPQEMQGRSFASLLKGQTPADWRKSLYFQYFEYPVPHQVHPHYGVVTDRYKLFRFFGTDVDYWELIDLEKDPREMRSVYGQPEYATVQAQLTEELNRLRTELKVPENIPQEWFGGGKKDKK